jgi:DNA polymerase-1
MVKIFADKVLRDLGYNMLLQVHDELIFEGPEDHAKEALARVVELMSNPLEDKLLVDLVVDAKVAKNWYEAK